MNEGKILAPLSILGAVSHSVWPLGIAEHLDSMSAMASKTPTAHTGPKFKPPEDELDTLCKAGLDSSAVHEVISSIKDDPNKFIGQLKDTTEREARDLGKTLRAFQPMALKSAGRDLRPLVENVFGKWTAQEILGMISSLPEDIKPEHMNVLDMWPDAIAQGAKAFHGSRSKEAQSLFGTRYKAFVPFDIPLIKARPKPTGVRTTKNKLFVIVKSKDVQTLSLPSRISASLGFMTPAYHPKAGFGFVPTRIPEGVKGFNVHEQSFFEIVDTATPESVPEPPVEEEPPEEEEKSSDTEISTFYRPDIMSMLGSYKGQARPDLLSPPVSTQTEIVDGAAYLVSSTTKSESMPRSVRVSRVSKRRDREPQPENGSKASHGPGKGSGSKDKENGSNANKENGSKASHGPGKGPGSKVKKEDGSKASKENGSKASRGTGSKAKENGSSRGTGSKAKENGSSRGTGSKASRGRENGDAMREFVEACKRIREKLVEAKIEELKTCASESTVLAKRGLTAIE